MNLGAWFQLEAMIKEGAMGDRVTNAIEALGQDHKELSELMAKACDELKLTREQCAKLELMISNIQADLDLIDRALAALQPMNEGALLNPHAPQKSTRNY